MAGLRKGRTSRIERFYSEPLFVENLCFSKVPRRGSIAQVSGATVVSAAQH